MTFFNIFSKKPAKENKKLKIIVDNREKNSLVAAELIKRDIEIEFQQLPIADYLVNGIAIERKTVSDFKSSIINKRIFGQIKNLQQYEKHLIILEGIMDEDVYGFGMHENAFRGFMLSLALEYKTHIIFTHNAEDTAKYLFVLANKKSPSIPATRPSRISATKPEQIQFILEGFPNIGPAKAKKLVEKFKSLRNIFNAKEEELQPILGKRTKDFKSLLE